MNSDYDLPPDYEERKRKLLVAKGFDPLVDDLDLDTMSVVPRKEPAAGIGETLGTAAAYNLPEAASSMVGARGGTALVSGLASLLGRAAPHPALKAIGALVGAIGAPMVSSRFTNPIKEAVSPGVTERLETMKLDRPWAAGIGAQASALPFMRMSNPLKSSLPNIAAGVGLGAGIPIAQDLQEGSDINIAEAVTGGLGGAFMSEPTRLGSRLSGLHPTIVPEPAPTPAKVFKPRIVQKPPIPADERVVPFDTGEQVHPDTGFEGWRPPEPDPSTLKQPQESADWETQGGDYTDPSFDPIAPKPISVDPSQVSAFPEDPSGPPPEWRGRQPILPKPGFPEKVQEALMSDAPQNPSDIGTVGSVDQPPTQEAPTILKQQTALALDPKSTRSAVLFTPGEVPITPIPAELVAMDTPHGTVYFNPQKISVDRIRQAAGGRVFDSTVLGMSDSGQTQTTGGRVVTSTSREGVPGVAAEVVPDRSGPLGVQRAIEAQKQSVPGGKTEVKRPSYVAQERMKMEAEEAAANRQKADDFQKARLEEESGLSAQELQDQMQHGQVRAKDQSKRLEEQKRVYGFGLNPFSSRRVKSRYGPQDEPDIKPRAGLNPFKSEVDKLRKGGVQQAEMADATDILFNKRREYTGRYANPILGAFEKLSPEKQQKVWDVMIKEDRLNQGLWTRLAPDEQTAYKEIRHTLNEVMPNEQIAAGQQVKQQNGLHRQRGKRKHFTPNIVDRTVQRIISEGQGSPQYQKLKRDFIQWQTGHGISNVEAEKRFERVHGSFKTAFNDNQFAFGSVREPEGVGLPDSWIERDPIHAMRKYVNRFARDRAFYDVIETNPRLMRMLGSDTYRGGLSIPQGTSAVENLASDKQVQNILNNYSGADQGGQEPVISGIGRVINSAILSGPITKLTDIGTVPFKALAYIPTGHEGVILKGIANWRKGYKDAFDQGLNRRGGLVVMQDILGIGEKAADAMSRVAETITKVTGSEQLELVSRGLSQSIGNYIAEAHVDLARAGDQKSIRFLERLGKDWQTQTPKELGTRVAQLLQGRYDITNLPRWAVDSPFAPFLGMMKWSVEQTNNFVKHVVDPAMNHGDFGPFIKTIIGGVGGGLLLNEMREELSGKKPYTATWKELEAGKDKPGYKDALTYKMIGAAQVTGTAGILMEILRQGYEEATGRMPQGFRYPVYEVGKDALQRMVAAVNAIREGEDTEKVTMTLTKDLLSRHVQMARIIKNQLGKSGQWKEAKEDIDRSNMMRDEDTYNRMMDKPQAAKVQTPPSYSRLTEKEFDKEEDLGKAAKMVPGLVKRAVKKAHGDPATMKSELRKLSTIDVRGMPSPERDPIGFASYYNWMRKTQGDEKARKFTSEFMKRRALTDVKRDLIPKVD